MVAISRNPSDGHLFDVQVNTKCLETLNLGHNTLTTEGIHRLKDGLLQNKSLLRIGLQASKITCEGQNLEFLGMISFDF